eukprot:2854731-Prymnesium_polylepis.1
MTNVWIAVRPELTKMLRAAIYLDSSSLTDLRELLEGGLAQSDVVVIMLSRGVFTRPWCLLELWQARRSEVPVLPLWLANGGFNVEEAMGYVSRLPTEMGKVDPAGLEVLHEHVGDDIADVQDAAMAVLEEIHPSTCLQWNSSLGDNGLLAQLKDLAEAMCRLTGQQAKWVDTSQASWSP